MKNYEAKILHGKPSRKSTDKLNVFAVAMSCMNELDLVLVLLVI